MREMNTFSGRLLNGAAMVLASLLAGAAQAAVPGITAAPALSGSTSTLATSTFNLSANAGYVSQPDGASLYTWGYGCAGGTATFVPSAISGGACGAMQLPGPTLIVNQGDTVTVTLTNNLPAAAGNTSILFPGFKVSTTGGAPGVLTQEASHTTPVRYSFVADTAGTHSYYSGTQGDLQVEMGLYGAIIVLPAKATTNSATGATSYTPLNGARPTNYTGPAAANLPDTCFSAATGSALPHLDTKDYRLAAAAYDHPSACYEREYMFQFSEIDPAIHTQALEQVTAELAKGAPCTVSTGCMSVATEPYHPAYFLINGRSFPDDADPNYSPLYPSQPYNGNPHMHPGELVLVRVIGQGRLQHPLHEHANHLRVLARDGNMLLTATNKLAGPLLFTTTTTPGQTLDAIFQYTAKGLNWDVYAHTSDTSDGSPEGGGGAKCDPDANGYYTTGSSAPTNAPNYYEWCLDHKLPLENKPFGTVGGGGPVTLPEPTIVTNGPWYGGSPYLGPDATGRAVGSTPIPPSGTIANDSGKEAGFAYMWHSHNEREITTNNIFPGGMMMMMMVDPWVFLINEAN
jgi:FtsP/CotA-like multicopper oxidase with cupredoxin domain